MRPGSATPLRTLHSGCQAVLVLRAPAGSNAVIAVALLHASAMPRPSTRVVSRWRAPSLW